MTSLKFYVIYLIYMIKTYYTIIKNEGIFEEGMMCYCFAQDQTHLYLYFKQPIIDGVHEVRLPRSKIYLLKRAG